MNIIKLLEYSDLNTKSFSEKIGLYSPQRIYNIQKDNTKGRSISCQVKEETLDVIDELSRDCGISTGEVIDIIVDSYVEMCNRDGQ